MGMRMGGVEMASYGARNVCVLGNNPVEGGSIVSVAVMANGMDIIRETGMLPDGRMVGLVNSLGTDEETVKAINTERDHWGNGRGDAFVGICQNRVKASDVSGNKGFIRFDGVDQAIPVDEHGIMLHALGFNGANLEYKMAGAPVWDPARNYASVTMSAMLEGWFSPILIIQQIILHNGVTTRKVRVMNTGGKKAPWSCTTHRYSKFPSEQDQPRDGIRMDIGAGRILNTLTQPFVAGETLLPDFSKSPFGSVGKTPFKKLFSGNPKERTLEGVYLDHCFVGLNPERVGGETNKIKFAARLRYPQAGYGIEVYVPFNNGSTAPVNALQVYTPPKPAAAYGTAAFEFAAAVTDPFDARWSHYPVSRDKLHTPSGLRILHPHGHGDASAYTYTVVHRMINMAKSIWKSAKDRTIVAVDGFKGSKPAAPITTAAAASKGMKGDVAVRVKKILIDVLSLDKHQISKMGIRSRLIEDLGADSLDESELIMAFEEKFGIEVDDRVEFSTVGDVLGVVETALAEKAKKKGK